MTRIIINPGLPKTGSTLLQTYFYPHLEGLINIGKSGPMSSQQRKESRAWRRAISHLRDAEGARYNQSRVSSQWEAIQSGLKQDQRPILLSDESLTSCQYRKRHGLNKIFQKAQLRDSGFNQHRAIIAKKLKQTFHEASILIIIREQVSWTLSVYSDLVYRWGLQQEFHEWLENGLASPKDFICNPDYQEAIINPYCDNFENSDVHILTFEELTLNPDQFEKDLFCILQYSPNKYSGPRIKEILKHKINTRLENQSNYNNEAKQRKVSSASLNVPCTVPPDLAAKIRSLSRTCNQQISDRFGLDLQSLGYAI
jgi:hypothetical protein